MYTKKTTLTSGLFPSKYALKSREEATRTPDPHVPNVVRYQLRYFSIAPSFLEKAGAKVLPFFCLCK